MSEEKRTREQIEQFRRVAKKYLQGIRVDEVCDLALQSLSQEAVRDEALGYCWLIECNDGTEGGPHYWSGNVSSLGSWTKDAFKAIRFQRKIDAENIAVNHSSSAWKAVCHHFDDALKREPNAAAGWIDPGAISELPQYMSALAAPDVTSMVKRLREHARDPGLSGITILGEAAALLAKLGQGWIPVKNRSANYPAAKHLGEWDIIERERADGKLFSFTLPPLPGASDE